VLAGLVGRSTDWLAKAESGRRRPTDRHARGPGAGAASTAG
jgi:hypothetical protein